MKTIARVVLAAAASTCLTAVAPSLAFAKAQVTVDLDHQTIHVEDRGQVYDWKVSSGKRGYETPAGKFKVLWMDKDHHSDEYESAPMPDSIFFAPGYAIHGFAKSAWGHPVSHGCVRLPVSKAAILFDLVKADGADINVIGYSPTVAPTVASVEAKNRAAAAAGAKGNGTLDADASYLAQRGPDDGRGYADAGYGAPRRAAGGYYAPDANYADAQYAAPPPPPPSPLGALGALFGSSSY